MSKQRRIISPTTYPFAFRLVVAGTLFVLPAPLLPQTAPLAAQHFEVASVKQSETCNSRFEMSKPGSVHFRVENATMEFLLGTAYKVGPDQIMNAPSWINSRCYSVEALAANGTPPSNDGLRAMLRNLLADRFHLSLHKEIKITKGYALVLNSGPPTLQPTKGGAPAGRMTPEGLQLNDAPLGALASMLMHAVGAHVTDETNLQGNYDFDLRFSPDASLSEQDSQLPSVFTALRQQLGLKLVSRRIPVTMVVIDQIDERPTPN